MSRDEEILDAAERLFFERSYDGVAIDELAQAVGVTGSALYRHFGSKEEILAGLFDRLIDALLMSVREPDPDPRVDVHNLLRAFYEFNVQHPRLAAIWVREQGTLSGHYRRGRDRRLRQFSERWLSSLKGCFPDRDAGELTVAARGVQLLLMSEALRNPDGRRTKGAQELLLSMALSSLAPLGESTASVVQ